MRKAWEDSNKYPRGQFKNQQKVGGHFVSKPSDQNQARNQNLEGKVVKSSGNDQWKFKTCFLCGEKGHISTQCVKIENLDHKKEIKVGLKLFTVHSRNELIHQGRS